jgi:hypothetical protein
MVHSSDKGPPPAVDLIRRLCAGAGRQQAFFVDCTFTFGAAAPAVAGTQRSVIAPRAK